MMSRITKLLYRESSSLTDAAFVLGAVTVISQLLGFVRDRLFAQLVGPSYALDVYYAAFRIPDFLFVSIASLASITVLLPFLTERIGTGTLEEQERARVFFQSVVKNLSFLLLCVSAVLFVLMPKLAALVAPGFTGDVQLEFIRVSRLMLLSPIILGISNTFGAVVQLYRHFFTYTLSSLLYNLGIIFGIVFFYRSLGSIGLALGVVIGASAHLAIQIPVVKRYGFFKATRAVFDSSSLLTVARVSLPRTLGLAVGNLTMLVMVSLLSRFEEGGISIFSLTYNLQAAPLTIIGVSFSVASFPMLVRFFQEKRHQEFFEYVSEASRSIIFLALPLTALFLVLRAHIIRVILGSGRFTWSDTRIASAMLAVFIVVLVFQCLVQLYTRAFYAAGQTRKPLVINVVIESFKIFSAFGVTLYCLSRPGFGSVLMKIFGLPIGTTDITLLVFPVLIAIGTFLNAVWLFFSLRRSFPGMVLFPWKTLLSSLLASMAALAGSWATLQVLANPIDQTSFWGVFAQGVGAGTIGTICAAVVYQLLGTPEWVAFVSRIRRKIWRRAAPISEATDILP
jgi:putative peptidoglycan lipid II flippase